MTTPKPEKRFNLAKKSSIAVLAMVFALVVVHGIYPYIHGPSIAISGISNGITVTNPAITISGTALYTKELSVSGRSLPLSTSGTFDETILLHPGYNVISVVGSDRFGKTSSRDYAVVLKDSPANNVAINMK